MRDTIAPSVVLTSPRSGLVTNRNVTVTGLVGDNLSGVAAVQAKIDAGRWLNVPVGPAGRFRFTTALRTNHSADGGHKVAFRAFDRAGNVSAVRQIAFTLDTVAPNNPSFQLDVAQDSSPTGDGRTVFQTVTLVGQTSAQATLNLAGTAQKTSADAQGHFRLAGVNLALGDNRFTVVARDRAGNTRSATATVTRVVQPAGSLTLAEGSRFVTEATVSVALGQTQGTRTLSFEVHSAFDTADRTTAVEDSFLVYLVDPANHAHTLLDRGQQGTALFALSGPRAEYQTGIVRFDGTKVEIDVTSLGTQGQGLLVFQLLNHDGDTNTVVNVGPVASSVDPAGTASVAFLWTTTTATAGQVANLASLRPTASVHLEVANVRLDRDSGRYAADLRVRNTGIATGRNVVVLFPGLPGGVHLMAPSGMAPNGVPYVNFHDAIPTGGLMGGGVSDAITVTFDDPNLIRFALRPQVLAGLANRAPVLEAVAPLRVLPGGRLEVALHAQDPDGDPVTYSVGSTTTLPTGTLLANGTLVFTPTPGEVGTYQFTVTASDGAKTASRAVTLAVGADPVTSTRISGKLLDTLGNPLVGVPIELGRFQTTTRADGSFTLELPPTAMLTEDFDIVIPTGDPQFDPHDTGAQTIPFRRAVFDRTTGTSTANPRLQVNQVSAFIDASVVYGSDPARAQALRTNDGSGRLRTSPGDLLPFNSLTYFPGGPLPNDNDSIFPADTMFVAGDVRASENVGLAALHTVLVREHNRLADGYKATHPEWTDEQIYQAARRLVGAMIQQITYYEFVPALLGPDALPAYNGYHLDVDPSVSAMFSTVAFRVGHTLLTPDSPRLDATGNSLPGGPLGLRDAFFNMGPVSRDGVEPYLRGLVAQRAEQVDHQVIDQVRNFLFGPPGSGGMDLPSLNIQRGRDLGLPDYNTARADFGLPRVTSFAQITSDPALQAALQGVYGSIDRIDPWVGGLCEDHAAGAAVGPFFQAVLRDQFQRSRDGDWFWFENGQFTASELGEIRGTTLSGLIERNTTGVDLPASAFTQFTPPAAPAPAGGPGSSTEIRALDGSGNNPNDPNLGKAGQHLLANHTLAYGDGISTPSGDDRPNPRAISNAVNARTSLIPNTSGLTSMAVIWGQLLDHDLSLTPGGTTNTLKIHGERVTGDSHYPFIAEKLPLLLEHAIYQGVENVIARPIYLPALDVAHGKTIDPTHDTVVTTADAGGHEALPGASVLVKAGNLQDRAGNLIAGTVSITEVPPALTPAALPANLRPDLVVTIQPGEMVFTVPAPLSLPNRAGYAPGTRMDLWSINPITGVFDNVGTGEVNAEGTVIQTISGGIRNSSWHFFVPETLSLETQPDEDGCASCAAERPFASTVTLSTGAVSTSHALVSYQSLGAVRGLALRYDSLRADPRPIVSFASNYALSLLGTGGPEAPLIRYVADLSVSRGSFAVDVGGFSGGQFGLDGGEHFWQVPEGGLVGGAIQVNVSDLPSGVYDYTVMAGILRSIRGGNFVGSQQEARGAFTVVNSRSSPFGSGWGLVGLQELVVNPNGSVLLIDGDGTDLVFQPEGPSGMAFQSPPGDFSRLERLADGTYRRTLVDQTVYEFGTDNRLVTVRDRLGNTTHYEYDAGRLVRIIDPAGLKTSFSYEGGRVREITDPFGRVTRLSYDGAGNLVGVTDPDGSGRAWEYDERHLRIGERDERGNRSESHYDAAGRATEGQLADGAVIRVMPAQTQGLFSRSGDTNPLLSPPGMSVFRRAYYADANGNGSTIVLDHLGQETFASDLNGPIAFYQRSSTNLLERLTNGRGQVQGFSYNDHGQIIETSQSLPVASGTENAHQYPLEINTLFPLPMPQDSLWTPGLLGFPVDLNKDGHLDLLVEFLSPIVGVRAVLSVAYGNGNGTFVQGPQFSVSGPGRNYFQGVFIGDMDQDGLNDLVVLSNKPQILVYLANSIDPVLTTLPRLGSSLSLADISGDGIPDLVGKFPPLDFVGDFGTFPLQMMVGQRDGTFLAPVSILSDSGISQYVLGDINHDDVTDIAYLKSNGNLFGQAAIVIGLGEGRFSPPNYIPAQPISLRAVDLLHADGDENVDLVIYTDFNMRLFEGRGDGTFGDQQTIGFASGLDTPVAILDADNNSNPDLWVSSRVFEQRGARALTVRFGDGKGGFFLPGLAVGLMNKFDDGQIWGDFNEDGFPDLLGLTDVLTLQDPGFAIQFGDGQGGFQGVSIVRTGLSPFWVTAADLNGDGRSDLVTADPASADSIAVFMNTGNGTYGPSTVLARGQRSYPVIAEDYNEDAIPDLIVANAGRAGSQDPSISVFLGQGNGQFGNPIGLLPGIGGAYNITSADFTSDGHLDLIMRGKGTFFLVPGDGHGGFGTPISVQQMPATEQDPIDVNYLLSYSLVSADINGDSKPDLIGRIGADGKFAALLGNGDGTFSPSPLQSESWFASIANSSALAVGDFDADGLEDVVIAGVSIQLLTGRANGSFNQPNTVFTINGHDILTGLAVADFDSDGSLDLAIGSRLKTILLPGRGDGTFSSGQALDLPGGAITFADVTGSGDMALIRGSDGDWRFKTDFVTIFQSLRSLDPLTPVTNSFEYETAFNQLTRSTDERGHQTLYDIDPANGNVRSITQVVGVVGGEDDLVTQFTYTASGQVDTVTDPLGHITDYDYDPLGRLIRVTLARGTAEEGIRRYEYDPATLAGRVGLVTAFLDENGHRTEYEYDVMNRLRKVTESDPDGPQGPLASPVTRYDYDTAGNPIRITDARGNITTNEYDNRNRLFRTTDARGQKTVFGHDHLGNLLSLVDPLLNETRHRYDARSRRVETIDTIGGHTKFAYDFDNNLVRVTDPADNTTSYTLDARNRVLSETDPRGMVTKYEYDGADNLVRKTDRDGRETQYSYDDLNRVTTETWVASGATNNVIHYTYDDAGNIRSVQDNASALAYVYDARNRVTTVDNAGTPGAPHVVLTYAYDAVGNVRSVSDTVNGQADMTNAYQIDALNRVTQVQQSGPNVADKRVDFSYNPLGQFDTISRFADLGGTQSVAKSSYRYDDLNRLTSLTHTHGAQTVSFFDFEYDDASRITEIEDRDGTTAYGYDNFGQLVSATHSGSGIPNEHYSYDLNGNRTSSSLHGTGYRTDTGNRLTSDGTFDYTYDDEGNLIRRVEIGTGKVREFTWDHRNRLVAVTDRNADDTPTQTVRFSYDALGRRLTKAVDTTPTDLIDAAVTHFVYDRDDVLVDFVDDDGTGPHVATVSEHYLHGPAVDQVLAQEDAAGKVLWHLADHLGTVHDLVDSGGMVTEHMVYDSFGNLLSPGGPTPRTRYLFTGREFDTELGLYYYRARYYAPSSGRFLGEDPIGYLAGTSNLFAYGANSPSNARDPLGLEAESDAFLTDVSGVAQLEQALKAKEAPEKFKDLIEGIGASKAIARGRIPKGIPVFGLDGPPNEAFIPEGCKAATQFIERESARRIEAAEQLLILENRISELTLRTKARFFPRELTDEERFEMLHELTKEGRELTRQIRQLERGVQP